MESRCDLNTILPFLPLIVCSKSLSWPSQAGETLKVLSRGPDYSGVDSGELLFDVIVELRNSINLSKERLAQYSAEGYTVFFDELLSRVQARKWFGEIVPSLAILLLRLPSLLESHYQSSDFVLKEEDGSSFIETGMRLLPSQEKGIVFLSQELIGALLACSLFCLFPTACRGEIDLPSINFDGLFGALYPYRKSNQEEKIKCLIHYFERICLFMPSGFVSFERKVLPFKKHPPCLSYPGVEFWSSSGIPLCPFQVSASGLIEDQQVRALEVDFANRYIGGGALHRGCVQEEIRFMINPELICGMLFLPSMSDNEAIEIIGAERYSNYTGYASSFSFSGDYMDQKPTDPMGRRKTGIVAIDALHKPGIKQYNTEFLLRETNKAFCGFLDQSKSLQHMETEDIEAIPCNKLEVPDEISAVQMDCDEPRDISRHPEPCSSHAKMDETLIQKLLDKNSTMQSDGGARGMIQDSQDAIGIATGNWGCGVFGGDPELKSMIQWLAASQASRPFILHYTFGEGSLSKLEEGSQWILWHKWTVGDLWSMLVEYSSQRLNGRTKSGFLAWLLPSLY